MKKMIALFAALAMTLGMSMSVMADESASTSIESIELTKNYKIVNTDTTAPAETFNFTVTAESVTDAADGITTENMPMLKFNAAEIKTPIEIDFSVYDNLEKENTEGEKVVSKDVLLEIPTYTSVGVYTYRIKETAGTTAGITYDDKAILVSVTVLKNEKGVYVAGVSYNNVGGTKMTESEGFLNQYKAGSLSVGKKVTGNMADEEKDFTVNVTFNGSNVNSKITYLVGQDTKEVTIGTPLTITLKHEETVTFKNIPYGVTYTVTEADYSTDGYDAAKYTLNGTDQGTTSVSGEVMDASSESVVITNNKDSAIATGVILDNLPYVLLLVVVAAGAVVMFLRKRAYERD